MLFEPFTPFMSADLCRMLGLDKISWNYAPDISTFSPEGAEVAEPHLLFDKIEDAPVEAQVKRHSIPGRPTRLAGWSRNR